MVISSDGFRRGDGVAAGRSSSDVAAAAAEAVSRRAASTVEHELSQFFRLIGHPITSVFRNQCNPPASHLLQWVAPTLQMAQRWPGTVQAMSSCPRISLASRLRSAGSMSSGTA